MFPKFRPALAATSAAISIAGCASVAVSNDAIEKNTAQALGLQRGTFTVSDRVDDGVKSSYSVKTSAGKTYSCYVTGSVSVVGRVVSDAVCSDTSKGAKSLVAPPVQPAAKECNALLKAAGKCS